MNESGALPILGILIWATIGVMAIGATAEMTGHHITLNNFPTQLLRSEASPTPQQNQINPITFNSPSVTLKPTKTQNVSQKSQQVVINTNQNSTITHDGTRTGPIIDYFSYCENKTIKVYENETIPFTLKDGKQIYSTKGDIDCYNQNNSSQVSGNSYVAPSANANTSPSYPPCIVYYSALHYSQTYTNIDPSTCKIWQDNANVGSNNNYQLPVQPIQISPTPQPTTDPYCNTAQSNWQQFKTNFLSNLYTQYSNSADAMRALYSYQQTYQAEANSHGCAIYLGI